MQDHYDIGSYNKKVTTSSTQCQKWVNRALMNLYGFNHYGAIQCFQKAIKEDQDCCFAYWGIAYAYGPHYNAITIGFEDFAKGLAYLELAQGKMMNGAEWEKDMIGVLRYRYPGNFKTEPVEAMGKALIQFSAEFKKIHEKYPEDIEIACIYAESLMNLNPWKLWSKTGQPTPEAILAKQTLEKTLKKSYHPFTCHLYLHLIQLSPFSKSPEALSVADLLYSNIKGIAHLIHMPSHLYIQVGDYRRSLEANIRAVQADFQTKKYQGSEISFYEFYRAHNAHFAVWAAMFLGDYETAMRYSKVIREIVNEEALAKIGQEAEFYTTAELHVLIRFGKWKEILSMPVQEGQYYQLYRVTQYYSRTIANAVLGNIEEAEKELENFFQHRNRIKNRNYSNNTPEDIFKIAQQMALGQLLYRKARYPEAFAHLRKSVALSDALVYDEPWGWMQPPRHALGALLLEQGGLEQLREAEEVYKKDLEWYPGNVWALVGLEEVYGKMGEEAKGKREGIREQLEKAREDAKVEIKVSCFCKLK